MITPQEAFNRIWKHFITDKNELYWEKKEPNIFQLKYCWPNGKKDALGIFIKEGNYTESLERQQVGAIVHLMDFITPDANPDDVREVMGILLQCNQYYDMSVVYEEGALTKFEQHLRNLAKALNYPIDPPDHSGSAPVEETQLSS